MKRLLCVSVTAGADSTGRIASQTCRGAMDAGWDVLLAYGRGAPATDVPSFSLADAAGIFLHGLATRLADRHGLASRRATARLIEKIGDYRPDVVHLHNIHGYYLHYPTLFEYLARTGIPTVWTLHDLWPVTGHCAFFKDCNGWQCGCPGHCPEKAQYPAALFSNAARNFDLKAHYFNLPGLDLRIVGVSEWTSEIARHSLLSKHPVTTIPNGIDTNVFKPLSAQEGRPILLGVASNWDARKGGADFARLAEALDSSWRIRLVGVPRRLEHHLPSRIEILPYISDTHSLAEEYARARVFANLTYADTCALTQLEALACGTPVVTYASGGAPESITPECGCVVAPGADTPSLIAAIDYAAGLDRETCRSVATENYSLPKMQAAYIKLYDHCSQHSKSPVGKN